MERTLEILGIPVYSFGKVSSTMDVAEEFLGKEQNIIITADEQSKGRGRYGRTWFSPLGGLYFSWIIKKEPSTNFLSEMISLSIVESMKIFGINCNIKLPNDIITAGRKIAGMLLIRKEGSYIAGIGININNDVEDRQVGISMLEIIGKPVDKLAFLENFIRTYLSYKKEFCKNSDISLQKWSNYLIK